MFCGKVYGAAGVTGIKNSLCFHLSVPETGAEEKAGSLIIEGKKRSGSGRYSEAGTSEMMFPPGLLMRPTFSLRQSRKHVCAN